MQMMRAHDSGPTSPQQSARFARLEAQIHTTMRAAMKKMISEVAAKEDMTDEDADWLAGLVQELVDRMNSLTPSRRDLHEQLATSCDVGLTRQMLRYHAADAKDGAALVGAICGRLRLLCAPAQDEAVRALEARALEAPTLPLGLAELLHGADEVVTEIVRRNSAIWGSLTPFEKRA